MKKVIAKEWLKFFKLGVVGLVLVIVLVVSGEQLHGVEALVLGIMPYLLYQLYRAACWAMKAKNK